MQIVVSFGTLLSLLSRASPPPPPPPPPTRPTRLYKVCMTTCIHHMLGEDIISLKRMLMVKEWFKENTGNYCTILTSLKNNGQQNHGYKPVRVAGSVWQRSGSVGINLLNKNKSTQRTDPYGGEKTAGARHNKLKKELLIFSTRYFDLKNKRRSGIKTLKKRDTFVRIIFRH